MDKYDLFLKFVTTQNWDTLYSHYEPIGKDKCWIWTGGFTKSGYPLYIWRYEGKRVNLRVPHLFLALSLGSPYLNISINHARHLCLNKRCVNPWHLAKGSARDNKLDNPPGSSGYPGVHFVTNPAHHLKPWCARSHWHGKRHLIGYFSTREQAWVAYLQFIESHPI